MDYRETWRCVWFVFMGFCWLVRHRLPFTVRAVVSYRRPCTQHWYATSHAWNQYWSRSPVESQSTFTRAVNLECNYCRVDIKTVQKCLDHAFCKIVPPVVIRLNSPAHNICYMWCRWGWISAEVSTSAGLNAMEFSTIRESKDWRFWIVQKS